MVQDPPAPSMYERLLGSKQNAHRQISNFVNISIQPVDCPRIWNMGGILEKKPLLSVDVITIGPFYLVQYKWNVKR